MIRPATAGDVDFVAALERAVFGPDAWSPASVAEEIGGPGRLAWVADGAGYVIVRTAGDAVDLQRIAVAGTHRREGVARSLLKTARTAAPGRMLLEVSAANRAAVAFYLAEGFTEISRRPRYYRDGTDAIVMEAP